MKVNVLIRSGKLGLTLLSIFMGVTSAWAANDCLDVIDFTQLNLAKHEDDLSAYAVAAAYSDISFQPLTRTLVSSDGSTFVVTSEQSMASDQALIGASFLDQFRYVYPLSFDQEQRQTPWFDPGRLRNVEFMSFLYFQTEAEAKESLTIVASQEHGTTFQVTQKRNVACQLQAVLDEIGSNHSSFFREVGGSFNWRLISGTDRLSVHSFGAAVDLNSALGGYWKWTGRSAGNVGTFDNKVPRDLVEAFERFGFIWGGKWHHYDGMHFEYRPELIVYARMIR